MRKIAQAGVIYFLLTISLLAAACAPDLPGQPVNAVNRATVSPIQSPTAEVNSSPPVNSNSGGSEIKDGGFLANLPADFVQPTDDTGRKLLRDYGAVFVARGGVTPPKTVVFRDEKEVVEFQAALVVTSETIGGVTIRLQAAAMQTLKNAVTEAALSGASITPRGADAAARSYEDTVGLWASRVHPALAYWSAKGRISAADATRIRSLTPFEQVPEILKLESRGIYFSKDLSKSIVYSVAPPGASQHLSLLAVDITGHENAKVRAVLAKHGWYQTVVSDLPHFTFLGVPENDLPKLGLKKVSSGERVYWVPDI